MTSKNDFDPGSQKNQAIRSHEEYTSKLIVSTLDFFVQNAIHEYAKREYRDYPDYKIEHTPEYNSWGLYVSQPEFKCSSSAEEALRKDKMLCLNVTLGIIDVAKLIFRWHVTVEINLNAASDFQFHQAYAIPHEPNPENISQLLKTLEDIIKSIGSKIIIKECKFENKYNYIRKIVDTRHFRKACS